MIEEHYYCPTCADNKKNVYHHRDCIDRQELLDKNSKEKDEKKPKTSLKYIKLHEAFDFVNTIWLKEQVSEIGKEIKKMFSLERKELLVCILAPEFVENGRELSQEEINYNKDNNIDQEADEKKIIEAINITTLPPTRYVEDTKATESAAVAQAVAKNGEKPEKKMVAEELTKEEIATF